MPFLMILLKQKKKKKRGKPSERQTEQKVRNEDGNLMLRERGIEEGEDSDRKRERENEK